MKQSEVLCVMCGGQDVRALPDQPEDYEYFMVPGQGLRFYHCDKCHSEFIHPRPTVEELISYYPLGYHVYNEDHGFIARTLVKIRSRVRAGSFLRLVSTRPVRLFDVGAGDCRHFIDMSKYGDFEFAGVEIKPEMVEKALERGFKVESGTIEDMDTSPYENSFDIVTMYQLVEHVLDPEILFEKAFSILKPGGYVTGQLPSMDCIERNLFGRYWAAYHYPRHLQLLTKKSLHGLIEQSGFRDISVKSALHLQAAQSIQNVLVGKCGYRPKITYGKTPIYSGLLLLAAPFCLAEHLIGRGGMMNFIARKPFV